MTKDKDYQYHDDTGKLYLRHPIHTNLWLDTVTSEAYSSMREIEIFQPWEDTEQPYRLLKPYIDKEGYPRLFTHCQGRKNWIRFGRFVWECYNQKELDDHLEIDHIDRNVQNNDILNLRPASRRENACNRLVTKKQYSPGKCVYRFHGKRARKNGKNFQTQIMVNGKMKYLGTYKTLEEAKEVYKQACMKYHGSFALWE